MESNGRLSILYPWVAHSDQMGMFTGLAILNPGKQETTVLVKTFTEKGQPWADTVELVLEPGQRVVDVLAGPSFFGPKFSQSQGYFQVLSRSPVVSSELFGDSKSNFLSSIQGIP